MFAPFTVVTPVQIPSGTPRKQKAYMETGGQWRGHGSAEADTANYEHAKAPNSVEPFRLTATTRISLTGTDRLQINKPSERFWADLG